MHFILFHLPKFLVLIAAFCFLLEYSESKRLFKKASFGAWCNATVKCDIHSLLTCDDNVCQCLYHDSMTYSSELGTCVSMVNEVCGYLESKRVFINCVANAFCDQQQGTCKCSKGFVESTFEPNCVKQKEYGEPCRSDSECLTELSLTCFEEMCQCDPENHVPHSSPERDDYESSEQVKCVSLASKSCTPKTGCVPKASCRGESDEVILSSYSWMSLGICKCDDNYEIDEDGYCRGKYGAECDVLRNVSCSKKFQCLNGVCSCRYPKEQIYLEEDELCASTVGGPCTVPEVLDDDSLLDTSVSTDEKIYCSKHLECKNISGGIISTCGCKAGFVENKNKGCDLGFGQRCSGDLMRKCDAAGDLHCVNGICACLDDLKVYDVNLGKCVGKIGSSCEIREKGESFVDANKCSDAVAVLKRGKIIENTEPNCGAGTVCQLARQQLQGLTSRGMCLQLPSSVNDDDEDVTAHTD